MLYKYKISNMKDEIYDRNISLNDNIFLNYNTDELYSIHKENGLSIACYGYCFDVRAPQLLTKDTLKSLSEKVDNLEKEIQFLNGQYILIVQINEDINLYSDSSSLVPVYFSKQESTVTNVLDDNEEYYKLNPNFKLNLNSFTPQRISYLKTFEEYSYEELVDYFMSLLSRQYEYFTGKNIDVPFRADNYQKTLFALLSPILVNNNLVIGEDSDTKEQFFSKLFSEEFRMNLVQHTGDRKQITDLSRMSFIARNNLSNFKALYNKNSKQLKNEKLLELYHDVNGLKLFNYEMNLMDINSKSNFEISSEYLIFEPLNVREVLNVFIEIHNRKKFNFSQEVINKFRPSLYYFNFTKGKTLRELNQELTDEITNIKNNGISTENQKFLLEVKRSNFRTSQNLDGKIKHNEILVFPSNQKIQKGNEYTVDYINPVEGLVYIEGFYKNKKNANRIIITVNEKMFNIFDFYKGKYFYHDGETRVNIKYMNDYDNLSWQKAGTLLIKQAE